MKIIKKIPLIHCYNIAPTNKSLYYSFVCDLLMKNALQCKFHGRTTCQQGNKICRRPPRLRYQHPSITITKILMYLKQKQYSHSEGWNPFPKHTKLSIK